VNIILKAEDIAKNYLGKKALDGLNVEIQEGKIIGILGPNGSGKTTFMKIAAGILRPTSGSMYICGEKPGIRTKAIVSYLPDINYLFKWMRIRDSINFFNDFYEDFDIKKAEEMLKFMKLSADDKITSLSKGMAEKLYLVLTLSRKAKLYILDEPLGGIDPVAREKIMEAIISNYREDSSIIISTHLVKDIERIFDEVLFISEGKIIIEGNAEKLREKHNKSLDELYREVFQEC
jgi:ABC-2 type transport system ATP-binding protein